MFTHEAKDLIDIPESLTVDPTAVMRVDYILHHPANQNVRSESGNLTNSAPPLAMLNLCAIFVRYTVDGSMWKPGPADLNEAGRMLLCMVLDAYPQHGEQFTLRDVQAVNSPSLLLLERELVTTIQ